MVMPRRFSSSRRSASMPVRARTRAVLPWSMCPAVPAIMFFMPLFLMLLASGLLAQQAPPANVPAKEDDIPLFKVEVSLVKVDLEVVERNGHNAPDFRQDDFVIYDENQ